MRWSIPAKKFRAPPFEVPNPLIVVEVLSPSTRQFDVSIKLAGHFRVPSLADYLIVDPSEPMIVHHARGAGATSSPGW